MLPINKLDQKFVPKNLRANCLNLSKRLVAIVVNKRTSIQQNSKLGHVNHYVDTRVSAGVHGPLLLDSIPETETTHCQQHGSNIYHTTLSLHVSTTLPTNYTKVYIALKILLAHNCKVNSLFYSTKIHLVSIKIDKWEQNANTKTIMRMMITHTFTLNPGLKRNQVETLLLSLKVYYLIRINYLQKEIS